MSLEHHYDMPIIARGTAGAIIINPKLFSMGLSADAIALFILMITKPDGSERTERDRDCATLGLTCEEFDAAEQGLLAAGLVEQSEAAS